MRKAILGTLVMLLACWIVFPSMGISKPEYATKEKVACTVCHIKPAKGDENLNEVGKCYKEKKDLAACKK